MLTITKKATDKTKGLILGDLRQVLTDCDFAGLPMTSPVKVRVGFRGQITALEVREADDA
ncbi:hypothetical protein GCM10022234_00580 [Aeromicrobium panaciterrae]|uniref:hypothetical protein n=1 Tax=Aeromicrobium panaciterrae TaxID=363861 RepID=UPI0031DB5EC2